MPLNVRCALVFLHIRHLAFGPDVFLDILAAVLVLHVPVTNVHARLQGAQEAHLRHEFHSPLEAKGAVALIRVQVKLGRNTHAAQLAVYQRGAGGSIGIPLSMMQAHGAGLFVKTEHFTKLNVRSVSFPGGLGAGFSICSGISRRIHYSPVDVAGNIVHLVNGSISRRLGTGGQQKCQVGAGRHGNHSNFLRVKAPLGRLPANHSYGPLAIFPGRLVDGKTHGTGSAVNKVDALDAQLGKLFVPHLNEPHVAANLVAATGDENHAGSVGVFRLFKPFQIGNPVFVGLEPLNLGLIGHGCNLMRLRVRHFALRPQRDAFLRAQQGAYQKDSG